MPLVDWQEILEQISHLLDGNTVYLEQRSGGLITLQDHSHTPRDIVGVAIAVANPELKPWETEEPASLMATKISNYLGRRATLLISRDADLFVGYYVHIGPK